MDIMAQKSLLILRGLSLFHICVQNRIDLVGFLLLSPFTLPAAKPPRSFLPSQIPNLQPLYFLRSLLMTQSVHRVGSTGEKSRAFLPSNEGTRGTLR